MINVCERCAKSRRKSSRSHRRRQLIAFGDYIFDKVPNYAGLGQQTPDFALLISAGVVFELDAIDNK